MECQVPERKRARVIINTDAKNEVDDQFAIVHGVLTPSFELLGFIAAHFGTGKSKTSMLDSRKEIDLLLSYLNKSSEVRVENGAENALRDDKTPSVSDGAKFIIEEAMKDDERPLHIAFLGPLTDMASAILMEPKILEKNIRVVWIGGGNWPTGCREYNLGNDITAANVVLKSGIELWQIPRNVYRMMPVSHFELIERVHPYGDLGKYLAEQVIDFNNDPKYPNRPAEYRVLGDSPAIGVIMYPDCGLWTMRKAPLLNSDMTYIHSVNNHDIRVYDTIDPRFIMEDFYAKLAHFYKSK